MTHNRSVSGPTSVRRQPSKLGAFSRPSILFFLTILFILAPKVDVVSLGAAALRVEDLVVLITIPFLLNGYRKRLAPPPSYVLAFFAFIAVSFISAIFNFQETGVVGFVYVARYFQYFIWFLIAAQFAPYISETRFRAAFGFIAIVLLLWWAGEASGIIPKIGRFSGVSNRITLNTSGPYETAILAILIYLNVPKLWQKIAMVGLLIATQSRITIASFAAIFIVERPGRNLLVAALMAPLAFVAIQVGSGFLSESRLASTQSPASMISEIYSRIETAPVIESLEEYRVLAVKNLNVSVDRSVGDASFKIRTFKWALIVKSVFGNFEHLPFGWGPGAWGLAVDGHYVRFLGETGVIGFIAAMVFFTLSLFSKDAPKPYKLGFFAMALSCVFIDAATSSKVSSTLWIVAAFYYTRQHLLDKQYAQRLR